MSPGPSSAPQSAVCWAAVWQVALVVEVGERPDHGRAVEDLDLVGLALLGERRFGGGPVFNFKSEGRRLDRSNPCLIPDSAFFEFTGKRYPKAKHRFALKDAPFMAIAGPGARPTVRTYRPSPC